MNRAARKRAAREADNLATRCQNLQCGGKKPSHMHPSIRYCPKCWDKAIIRACEKRRMEEIRAKSRKG